MTTEEIAMVRSACNEMLKNKNCDVIQVTGLVYRVLQLLTNVEIFQAENKALRALKEPAIPCLCKDCMYSDRSGEVPQYHCICQKKHSPIFGKIVSIEFGCTEGNKLG